MNKKYIAFGLMGVFLMVFATAMVVDYLSNEVTGDVVVASPITLSGDIIGSVDLIGGNTITKNIDMTNNANVDITTHAVITITAPSPWDTSLSEFDSLTLAETTESFGPVDIKTTCHIGADTKVLTCTLIPAGIPAGDTFNYVLTAITNPAIEEGTYSFTAQAMV